MSGRTTAALCALVLATACYDSQIHGPREDGGRPGPALDAAGPGPDAGGPSPSPPPPPPTDQLDLLFMVDNSNSMGEEQASLAAELPPLLTALATGDHDGDGLAEARAFPSIQVGVVTSDMGTGGFPVPTCARSDFGDDGILRTQGNTAFDVCAATYPAILAYDSSSGVDPADFAVDAACVAQPGLGGCGFEQQLEAVLKALTPTSAQPWTAPDFVPIGTPGASFGLARPFFRMSQPHGNAANHGFVRDDSMLAVVIVTDEEDCSAHDPELFNLSSPVYGTYDPNLRCFAFGAQALHPTSRYSRGLAQLRRHPSRVAYFVLGGIPVDLEPPVPGAPIDWDRLIGDPSVRDPRMIEQIDPSHSSRLVPSCNTSRGIAFPPIRLLTVGRSLAHVGARVGVGSICQESYRGSFTSFLRELSR